MTLHTGWLFRAEQNDIDVVTSEFSLTDIAHLLQTTEVKCEQFHNPEGTFCVWLNNDPKRQFVYNESAQHVLGSIQFPWSTFHGDILVTYLVKANESEVLHDIPKISLTEFVDACNLSRK